jgi:hypothetical protein
VNLREKTDSPFKENLMPGTKDEAANLDEAAALKPAEGAAIAKEAFQGAPTTSARKYLAALQKEHPPSYPRNSGGFDRAQALAGVLFGALPKSMLDLLAHGQVSVGEVGIATPDIRTDLKGLDDGERSVVVHSGQMDFYYAISRAAHGVARIYQTGNTTPINQMALPMKESVRLITEALLDWRRMCQPGFLEQLRSIFAAQKGDSRIRPASFELPDNVRFLAERLSTSAELFMIAHEFGHVALDSELAEPVHHDDEADADEIGLSYYLPSSTPQIGLRTTLGGMGFAVRVTGSLQEVGAEFSRAYDPPAKRLERLLQSVRRRAPSDAYHDESSTVLVNYLDQMDHADALRRAIPIVRSAAMNEWQGRVRLIAVLEEVAQGRAGREAFEALCRSTSIEASVSTLAAVGERIVHYYVGDPGGIGYQPAALRTAMGDHLRQIVPQLAPEFRGCFPV